MKNNLDKQQQEFVRRVAKDSVQQTINVEEIREAFKLLTNTDNANIRIMRKELYDYFNLPEPPEVLPDYANPDFDINKPLPETTELPVQELPVEKRVELYEQALDGNDQAKELLHKDYDLGFMKMINETKKPVELPKVEEQQVVDKRSKAYREYKKANRL
jgi:hypothetical protein